MDYKLVPYTDDFYHFVYDLKKTAYKKYVEECWGEWNEAAQQEMFDRFIDSVHTSFFLKDKLSVFIMEQLWKMAVMKSVISA